MMGRCNRSVINIGCVSVIVLSVASCSAISTKEKWEGGDHFPRTGFFDEGERYSTMSEMHVMSFRSAGKPTNIEGVTFHEEKPDNNHMLIRAWPRYFPRGQFWEIGRVTEDGCHSPRQDWWNDCDAVYGTFMTRRITVIDTQTGRELSVELK